MTRRRHAFQPAMYPRSPGQVHPDLVRAWVCRALAGAGVCLTQIRDQMGPEVPEMLRGYTWCAEGECDGAPCPMAVALQKDAVDVPVDAGTVMRTSAAVGRQLGLTDVQVAVMALAAVSHVDGAVRNVVALLVGRGVRVEEVVARMLGADVRQVAEALSGLQARGLVQVSRQVVDDDDDDDDEEGPW